MKTKSKNIVKRNLLHNCCNCDKPATVISYGGESGDYCFDHYIEMLDRINETSEF